MANSNKTSSDIILLGEREQQLEMLLHVQEFSAMVVLVTGADGIGKTELLSAASAQLSVHHQVVQVGAVQTNQLPDIIHTISEQLGCKSNLLDLDLKLQAMAQQQETLHLLIDDAHLIADDQLLLLIEKSTQNHGWHLVLCGDQSLKARLNQLQNKFESKLYHLIELLPFNEDETEIFIARLFKRSGIGVLPLSMKDIHQLWLLSKGVPGKLLELIELEQDHQKQRSTKLPIAHIAAVCLIGSALFVSFLYQDQAGVEVASSDDAIAMLLAQRDARKEAQKAFVSSAGLSVDEQNVSAHNPQSDTQLSDQGVASSALPDAAKAKNPTVGAGNIKQTLLVNESTSQKVKLSHSSSIQPTDKPITVAQLTAELKDSTTPSIEHPLLSAPSQSYALQLLGVRSEDSAKAFVRRFARQMDGSKLTIYETRHKGEPWFVVVYGPMDNKQQAKQQANQLSKTIQGQPWVRPISRIQADLKKAL